MKVCVVKYLHYERVPILNFHHISPPKGVRKKDIGSFGLCQYGGHTPHPDLRMYL